MDMSRGINFKLAPKRTCHVARKEWCICSLFAKKITSLVDEYTYTYVYIYIYIYITYLLMSTYGLPIHKPTYAHTHTHTHTHEWPFTIQRTHTRSTVHAGTSTGNLCMLKDRHSSLVSRSLMCMKNAVCGFLQTLARSLPNTFIEDIFKRVTKRLFASAQTARHLLSSFESSCYHACAFGSSFDQQHEW